MEKRNFILILTAALTYQSLIKDLSEVSVMDDQGDIHSEIIFTSLLRGPEDEVILEKDGVRMDMYFSSMTAKYDMNYPTFEWLLDAKTQAWFFVICDTSDWSPMFERFGWDMIAPWAQYTFNIAGDRPFWINKVWPGNDNNCPDSDPFREDKAWGFWAHWPFDMEVYKMYRGFSANLEGVTFELNNKVYSVTQGQTIMLDNGLKVTLTDSTVIHPSTEGLGLLVDLNGGVKMRFAADLNIVTEFDMGKAGYYKWNQRFNKDFWGRQSSDYFFYCWDQTRPQDVDVRLRTVSLDQLAENKLVYLDVITPDGGREEIKPEKIFLLEYKTGATLAISAKWRLIHEMDRRIPTLVNGALMTLHVKYPSRLCPLNRKGECMEGSWFVEIEVDGRVISAVLTNHVLARQKGSEVQSVKAYTPVTTMDLHFSGKDLRPIQRASLCTPFIEPVSGKTLKMKVWTNQTKCNCSISSEVWMLGYVILNPDPVEFDVEGEIIKVMCKTYSASASVTKAQDVSENYYEPTSWLGIGSAAVTSLLDLLWTYYFGMMVIQWLALAGHGAIAFTYSRDGDKRKMMMWIGTTPILYYAWGFIYYICVGILLYFMMSGTSINIPWGNRA